MPSIVSRNRTLLARKLSIARPQVSEKEIEVWALASVRAKLAALSAEEMPGRALGSGGLVGVAMFMARRRLDAFQYRRGAGIRWEPKRWVAVTIIKYGKLEV
jgi:hypothetical protein